MHASKTDQAERLDTNQKSTLWETQRGTRKRGSHYGASSLEEGNFDRDIQARRRAMKATVRKRYAFSMMAQLWVEEITGVGSLLS